MTKSIRIGIGKSQCIYTEDATLRLGGIEIANADSGKGKETIDCLIKALSDALLGAAALGGTEQISELNQLIAENGDELIREVERRVHYAGYEIVNIDSTISTKTDSVYENCNSICEKIASLIFIKPEQINMKVNLYSDSDLIPQQNIIECIAVVSLKKR